MKTGRKRLWGYGLRGDVRRFYRDRPITDLALKCLVNECGRAKKVCTKRLFS